MSEELLIGKFMKAIWEIFPHGSHFQQELIGKYFVITPIVSRGDRLFVNNKFEDALFYYRLADDILVNDISVKGKIADCQARIAERAKKKERPTIGTASLVCQPCRRSRDHRRQWP
jgi:hypothetical protein